MTFPGRPARHDLAPDAAHRREQLKVTLTTAEACQVADENFRRVEALLAREVDRDAGQQKHTCRIVRMTEDTAGVKWFAEFEPGSTVPLRTWREPAVLEAIAAAVGRLGW